MKHWDMTMEEAIKWWATVDGDGDDLAGVRTLCKIDRFYLLVRVCGRVDMLHPFIYARCREVERDPDGHLDLWAREHYKSTIITFGGIVQEILKDPEITVCIFSHVNAIASDFLRQIKTELEKNEILKKAFPDILYEDPAKQAARWSVDGGITVKRKGNPKEATLEASGLVDGMPTSKHYRLRVYDDVVTDKSVATPEQVEKTTNAYSLSQSLGTEGGREWGIGTRYSFADTYEWIIKRNALKVRIYTVTTDGTQEGPLALFKRDEWNSRKIKLTDNDIACQYFQDPLTGQNRMFDITQFGSYEVRPETLAIYLMCDPARSKKKTSANTAMAVVGVDYAMNKYLLDGFNHKMDLKERWEHFARLWMRWKVAPGVQIIHAGYESFGAQADMDYFEEQMQKKGQPRFEIQRLEWPRDGEGSKEDRVQRLVPDMRSHKIFLPYPTEAGKLTANQRRMQDEGYDYRISASIRRKDENGQAYDLAEQLKVQAHYFPFGTLKDLIDVFSRIYDMEIRAPNLNELRYAEPEFT